MYQSFASRLKPSNECYTNDPSFFANYSHQTAKGLPNMWWLQGNIPKETGSRFKSESEFLGPKSPRIIPKQFLWGSKSINYTHGLYKRPLLNSSDWFYQQIQ